MGDEITDYKKFAMPKPKQAEGGLKGVVLRVDAFGNLVTNFRAEHLGADAQTNGHFHLQVGTHSVKKLVDTYARGAAGEPIAYVGSGGYIEIGVNKGSAAKTLALGRGTPVVLSK
jgi:S-adenosylmethionine hydrolase